VSTHRILLVEDNPDDAELTRRAFVKSRLANDIIHVWDGEEALDWLLGRGEYSGRDLDLMPQLILLDLKLPKLDGLAVLDAIRANPRIKPVPVVMLTSSDEQEDIVRSYNLGVNSYIRKPVQFSAFVEAVAQLGLYWLVLNKSPYGG
jgi:two-component system response regulator